MLLYLQLIRKTTPLVSCYSFHVYLDQVHFTVKCCMKGTLPGSRIIENMGGRVLFVSPAGLYPKPWGKSLPLLNLT